MVKRVFDIVFAFLGLFILLPLLVLVAVFIKILMPGPIFFIQKRVGRKGVLFDLFKFRTMKVDDNKSNGSFDAGDTSRITAFGRILRKSKLDELPQLFNVLKGDMSIVGPRPEVLKWTQVYPEKWQLVLTVKPGITDPASIVYRNEEEILYNSTDPELTYKNQILPKKLDLYVNYVNNKSFCVDIKIIINTIKVILTT